MKIYLSADIEGVTGTTHWNETESGKDDFSQFQEQMTAEAAAACEGALAAGAQEIWVKDAHSSGRNLIISKLPPQARIIRGWSGHPFSMVQDLDETFHAVLMIGYHSRAGSDASPLAHTISGNASDIKINERYASEFLIHTFAAALVQVPVVFLSGDAGICQEAQSLIPQIRAVAVKTGKGNSTRSIHPERALSKIQEEVREALKAEVSKCLIKLPERFQVEIRYRDHEKAYRYSFFPGAKLIQPHVIRFETDHYFEVLRLLSFVL